MVEDSVRFFSPLPLSETRSPKTSRRCSTGRWHSQRAARFAEAEGAERRRCWRCGFLGTWTWTNPVKSWTNPSIVLDLNPGSYSTLFNAPNIGFSGFWDWSVAAWFFSRCPRCLRPGTCISLRPSDVMPMCWCTAGVRPCESEG